MRIAPLPRIGAPLLTLGASVFLVSAYNLSFWKTFVAATGGMRFDTVPVHAGAFLLLVLLFNAILTLFNFRFVIKPVLIALFLGASAASYFMNEYGVVIDASMVQNVFETDPREAHELLGWRMAQTVTVLGILPSLLVWHLPLAFRPVRRDLLLKTGTVAASLLAAAGLLLLLFKVLAPAVREHRELRFLLTPTNMFQATHSYLKRRWSVPVVIAPLGTDAAPGPKWTAAGARKRTVTVIVVGETARAMNFSLNGYARQTNPALARQAGLINFRNVSSCGTATAVSVPCVFSGLTRDDYSADRAGRQEGLLDVLKHAGFDVLWRDNNSGCKGVCDRVRFEDVSQPVPGDPLCNGEECFDERLLRGLPEMIRTAQKDLVVVLHQKGSHGPAYWKRYPPGFSRFEPVCRTNELERCSRESIVNAYDNSILYTDYFLARTLDLLRASAAQDSVDTAMLYFSDHGESLGENNLYLHGAPYIISPAEQRTVPMMLWLSDGFRQRFRFDRQCLAARSAQAFSHDNVFHSVLGLLNVSTAVYNPRLDLTHPCTRGN
ncbi:phosphoethanolamine transferase [Pseudoduganella chitinolytica]|uniref:Phosphoethanolamine--lipid A transferase n=1 Tax=Pseudoduganella chitinolytica TaxID=34070 RepID=A0ABY8BC63_9BURK|nr:phosphoethanolamine--lipid A transferase [Pseudoduganella chitinolytica]WEF32763.1 phosphoethanolamine--lipid A transferase [Pseudoduganella chitinolytica]